MRDQDTANTRPFVDKLPQIGRNLADRIPICDAALQLDDHGLAVLVFRGDVNLPGKNYPFFPPICYLQTRLQLLDVRTKCSLQLSLLFEVTSEVVNPLNVP